MRSPKIVAGKTMEIGETLLVRSRQEWRAWLAQHHHDRKEIWLIYYKKAAQKTGISYEESVEEALCFGWIDGINKSINQETYAGRFTPRRPKSSWSTSNRKRIARLLQQGRMTEAGLATLPPELLQDSSQWPVPLHLRGGANRNVVAPLVGARLLQKTGNTSQSLDIVHSEELARRMAEFAHRMRNLLITASNPLHELYETAKGTLSPELTLFEFADMLAQTLVFGLLAARFNATSSALLDQQVIFNIPCSNPFLRELFVTMTNFSDLNNESPSDCIKDLWHVLAGIEMDTIWARSGRDDNESTCQIAGEDALVHFYEAFLAHYNPKLRKLRGVYYTPEPVVSYVVRSVDSLLRSHFDCYDGLADTSTLSYLNKVSKRKWERAREKGRGKPPHLPSPPPPPLRETLLVNETTHAIRHSDRKARSSSRQLNRLSRRVYSRGGGGGEEGWALHRPPDARPLWLPLRSISSLSRIRQQSLRDVAAFPTTMSLGYSGQDEQANTNREDLPRVVLLDPACGTGTFLCAAIDYMRKIYQQRYDADRWQDYVRNHLLPRLFGFELLPTAYTLAHLNIAMQLAVPHLPETERRAWAYDFKDDESLNIYLTNFLEKGTKDSEHLPGMLNEGQVMVVLGNPPYSGHSINKGDEITALLETYKEGCPELKKPAQAKWLSDDYVKFMRLAQWYIERTGYGILAFITNHSYLDNPTFRGMRRSLLASFDDMYILDLHGNSKKKELAPDGSQDENVFDIRQGVAISIFVKWRTDKDHKLSLATVHHADLWGPCEVYEMDAEGRHVLVGGKLAWLAEHDLASTPWQKLKPQPPLYLFAPQDIQRLAEYEAGWSIPDIFRPNGDPAPGIVTTHDDFAVSWSSAEAIEKVERLLSTHNEAEARRLFRLCTQDQWQYSRAREELADNRWRQEIVQLLYRPFDIRWTVFNRQVAVHRRERVMRHMLAGDNRAITIGKAGQVIDTGEWNIVFCSRYITEYNLYRRGGNNLFPLYLYPDDRATARARGFGEPSAPTIREGNNLFSPYLYSDTSKASSNNISENRRANLSQEFITDFAAKLNMTWVPDGRGNRQNTFGPEDIFSYMYAIFYSPTYRSRYAPFLRIDFPRLPLTSNAHLFRKLCKLGDQLVAMHLLEQEVPSITDYPVPGDNYVEKVRYVGPQQGTAKGQVWINASQYFDGVSPEAWSFQIGGYQVCLKWLKDRKGRKLSQKELMHYQQIVAILAETSRLMKEIDAMIENFGGWPISR